MHRRWKLLVIIILIATIVIEVSSTGLLESENEFLSTLPPTSNLNQSLNQSGTFILFIAKMGYVQLRATILIVPPPPHAIQGQNASVKVVFNNGTVEYVQWPNSLTLHINLGRTSLFSNFQSTSNVVGNYNYGNNQPFTVGLELMTVGSHFINLTINPDSLPAPPNSYYLLITGYQAAVIVQAWGVS